MRVDEGEGDGEGEGEGEGEGVRVMYMVGLLDFGVRLNKVFVFL